jgi:acetyl esterase/lipase
MAIPKVAIRGVRFEPTTLAGRGAEWVTPRGVDHDGAPVILYLHGGAYLFGSIEEYRDFVARIARAASVRAIVLDYRLAPEHPFPAAIEDATAAYRALLESGIPPSRLVVAGDSAGGGLTAALLVTLRDQGLPMPAAAVLVCPWVDLGARGGTLVTHEPYDFFTPHLVEHWARTVLAGADASDPLASPANADLGGLPPLLVQAGGAEMIRDQIVTFADRARAAGVEVTLRVWKDCFHDWPLFAAVLDDGRRATDEIGQFVGRAVDVPKAVKGNPNGAAPPHDVGPACGSG